MGLCDSCMGEMCHLWHIPGEKEHHWQKVKGCENLIGEPWIGKSEKINSVKRAVWKEIGDYCSMRRYNGRKYAIIGTAYTVPIIELRRIDAPFIRSCLRNFR